jgi:hypothetical protein
MAAKGLGNGELPGGAKEAVKMAAVSSTVLAHCWLLTVSASCLAVLRMAMGLVHEYH